MDFYDGWYLLTVEWYLLNIESRVLVLYGIFLFEYFLMRFLFLACLFLIGISSTAYAATFNTESFESVVTSADLKGSEKNRYGVWIDGGSSAFTKTSEYYAGGTSFAIAPLDPGVDATIDANGNYVDSTGEVKQYYGSFYTETLDFTGSTEASVAFRYLLTNSSGDTEAHGNFSIEVSSDDGETFTKIATPNELSPIKSSVSKYEAEVKAAAAYCNIFILLPSLYDACLESYVLVALGADGSTNQYWSKNIVIEIPPEYLSATTVIRFKGYFDNDLEPKLKAYFDRVKIKYEGDAPKFSAESINPVNDTIPTGALLYDEATFDGPLTDGLVTNSNNHDWGIWTDGGRNSYLTGFLSEGNDGGSTSDTNAGAALKWTYIEGQENPADPDGSATGEHKPTYSSIVTANTDFSTAKDLAVEFSFVGYGLDISQEEYFRLSISTNSGIDYVPVKEWVVGEDFINLKRYQATVIIPGDSTDAGRLTQTTQLRIQSHGDTEVDHTYIDSIKVYTIGTGPGLEPANLDIDWKGDETGLTVLNANTAHVPTDSTIVPAYDLINSAFIKAEIYQDGAGDFEGKFGDVTNGTLPCIYGAIEHTDDTNPDFGPHIKQEADATLGTDVFYFYLHQTDHTPLTTTNRAFPTPGSDRCRTDATEEDFDPTESSYKTDRQRMEIKGFSESYDHQLGEEGETHYMSWKMKLPADYGPTDKFTHLHQLKPKGGSNESMPTITLSAVAAKGGEDEGEVTTPAKLNLRYSPTTASQVTLASIDLADISGKWVHIVEKVTYGVINEGRYELLVMDVNNLEGEPIMSFASDSIATWKGGDYVRPKWGIYRSIAQGDKVNDEDKVGFADFVMLELNSLEAEFGKLLDFAYYANSYSNGALPSTPVTTTTSSISGTSGDDVITLSQDLAGNVTATVNGLETLLSSVETRRLQINARAGNDSVTVDQNVEYGTLSILGGAGHDTIIGGKYDDNIRGQAGKDIIVGRAGDDTILGGDGNDIIVAGYGDDNIYGQNGSADLALYDNQDVKVIAESKEAHHEELPANVESLHLDVVRDHLVQFKGVSETITMGVVPSDGNMTEISSALDVNGVMTDPEVVSSFSIATQNKVFIEGYINKYNESFDETVKQDALIKINRLLANRPEIYGKYVLWRFRDDSDASSVALINYIYDVFITDYLANNNDATVFEYKGEGLFSFDSGATFRTTSMESLEYALTDWGDPLGTGEGRYATKEETWDRVKDEVGYFVVMSYGGKGKFYSTLKNKDFTYSDATNTNTIGYIVKNNSVDGSLKDSSDLLDLRFTHSYDPDITVSDPYSSFNDLSWSLHEAELVREGSGWLSYEISLPDETVEMTGRTVTVTLIKAGYKPNLSLWKQVSSSPSMKFFDYEHAFEQMDFSPGSFKISPKIYLEFVQKWTGYFYRDAIEVYKDPFHYDRATYSQSESQIMANIGYIVQVKALGGSLDNYIFTDPETGIQYSGGAKALEHLMSTDVAKELSTFYKNSVMYELFPFHDKEADIVAAIDTFLNDERSLEFMDIASPLMREAYFEPLIAIQAHFDFDSAQSTYDKLIRHQLTSLADSTATKRRNDFVDLGDGFGEGVDTAVAFFRMSGALGNNALKVALYRYDSMNYGEWREIVSDLREVSLITNETEAKQLLAVLVGERSDSSANVLSNVGNMLIDTGLLDFADGVGAAISLIRRMNEGREEGFDRSIVTGMAGDLLHMSKLMAGAVKAYGFGTSRFQSNYLKIGESLDDVNVDYLKLKEEFIAASNQAVANKEEAVEAVEKMLADQNSELRALKRNYELKLTDYKEELAIEESYNEEFNEIVLSFTESEEAFSFAPSAEVFAENVSHHFKRMAAISAGKSELIGREVKSTEQAATSMVDTLKVSSIILEGELTIPSAEMEAVERLGEVLDSKKMAGLLDSGETESAKVLLKRFKPDMVTDERRVSYGTIRSGGVFMKRVGALSAVGDLIYAEQTFEIALEECVKDRGGILCNALIFKDAALLGSGGLGVYEYTVSTFFAESELELGSAITGPLGIGIFAVMLTAQIVEIVEKNNADNLDCPDGGSRSDGGQKCPNDTGKGTTGTATGVNLALFGVATQSSTRSGGLAERAIDDDTNGVYSGASVTSTSDEPDAWWEVELAEVSDINEIIIYNRTDCCTNRLSEFSVTVLDENDNAVWAEYFSDEPDSVMSIELSATGKKVRISLDGKLSLAEVQVIGAQVVPSLNLALSGTVTQSSTRSGGDAERAIDGDTNGIYNDGSVTHTKSESDSWWEVELAEVSKINQIVIYNRTDCCTSRLSEFSVTVLDENDNAVWTEYYADEPDSVMRIAPNATGKKVRISLSGILSLAEVQVFGIETAEPLNLASTEPLNLASTGTATQSSMAYSGAAPRAIDGDTNGNYSGNSVTHTSNESVAWWEVELAQVSDINEIVIYNRRDSCCTSRLSEFWVTVLDENDNAVWTEYYADEPESVMSIELSETGKKVRISLSGTLSLAEVQVFGVP